MLFGSGKLPLLKHQTGILEVGDEFLIPTPPQLLPGALCDFGGPPAPEHAARSELDGCSHAGEAGSFNLAAWERVPMQTLPRWVFRVMCWTEGALVSPDGRKV